MIAMGRSDIGQLSALNRIDPMTFPRLGRKHNPSLQMDKVELSTLDQATGGDERVDPGEASDILDRVAPHQGQDVADPRAGALARQRHRVMAVSDLLEVARPLGAQWIIKVDQG